MYFNGSKRVEGAGAGVVLISPQGDKLKYVLPMSFPQASNNEAEYEALLHGMRMSKACGATRLEIFGDSNLVVQQVMNHCDAVSDNMTAYRNLYYYLEVLSTDVKYRTSADQATRKPTIWQTSGPNVCRYHQETSGKK
jgi:ribonuclease HI